MDQIPLPPAPEPGNVPMTEFEQFELMYFKWERQFEEWKRKNMHNPDHEYVDNYIYDMNLMKNRLLERRRFLQQKVDQEKARKNPLSTASRNIEVIQNISESIRYHSHVT